MTVSKRLLLASLVLLDAGVHAAEPLFEPGISVFANETKVFYRLPCLLVAKSGTVLASGQKRFGESGDFTPSSFVLRRSTDGGKTFGEEQVLFEKSGNCTFNGNLVEDRQSGTVFACFITFPEAERKTWFREKWLPKGGGFTVVKSSDDGKTWSAPIEIMPEPNADGWHGGGAFNNNHGVQLQHGPHTGRLIICARVFKKGVYEDRAKGGLIYSDDHGVTWRVGAVMVKHGGAVNGEVTVCETPGGEVYVNCRNQAGKLMQKAASGSTQPPSGIVPNQRIYSRSKDGGESFYEEGCHPELFDAPCNAGLTLIDFGNDHSQAFMLFTAPAQKNRSHLTGYVSHDGGKTWKAGATISQKTGGYSDAAATQEDIILTLFENAKDAAFPRGLVLARYNAAWLTR